MYAKDPHGQKNAQKTTQSTSSPTTKRVSSSRKVTEARATAQRAKQDAQAQTLSP